MRSGLTIAYVRPESERAREREMPATHSARTLRKKGRKEERKRERKEEREKERKSKERKLKERKSKE